jgi:hypothetical protein
MAPLAQLDGRRPLVKLRQQSGFNLLKLSSNPLLVLVSQHGLIIRAKYKHLQLDFQAFGGGPDFGVVVEGVFDHFVDDRVGVVGVVVIED